MGKNQHKKIEFAAKRNAAIYEDYKRLRDKKEHGVQKYTHEWICNELSNRYFLSADWIGRIIGKHGK